MIKRFRHNGLRRLYQQGDGRGIRPDLVARIEEILTVLDAAGAPRELSLPGYRLHPLKGDGSGLWAVIVRANWRIVSRFAGNDAVDVELIDYH